MLGRFQVTIELILTRFDASHGLFRMRKFPSDIMGGDDQGGNMRALHIKMIRVKVSTTSAQLQPRPGLE